MLKTTSGHLAPLTDGDREEVAKLKTGHVIEVKITRKRNPMFHRKFFALLGVAFDYWQEAPVTVEYHGQRVRPNFERFRKDITILAGYYDPTYNINGELRLEARSISFSSMEEPDFEKLYSSVLDVVLERILAKAGFDEKTLRAHVERVLQFD